MRVRKVTNISENDVGVNLSSGDVMFLKPQESIKDIDIDTKLNTTRSVKVEYDLSEINPIKEGTTRLCG